MKKIGAKRRLLSLLLVLAIVLPILPTGVLAALGDLSNVPTGLDGDINTNDTISLPIKILDYENDGMLFEYAESKDVKSASDFGASVDRDFTALTSLPSGNGGDYYYDDPSKWNSTNKEFHTENSYASYVRFNFNKSAKELKEVATTWKNDNRAGVIIPNDLGGIAIDNARYLVLVYRSNVTNGMIEFFVERTDKDRYNTNNVAGDYTFTSEGATNWTYAVYDLKKGNLANDWNGSATAIWTTLPIDARGEYIDIAHAALFSDYDCAKAFGEYALTDGSDRGDNRAFGLLRSSRTQDDGTNYSGYSGIADEVSSVKQLNTYSSTSIDFSNVKDLGYTLLGVFGSKGIANVGLLESSLSKDGYPVYKKEVVSYLAKLLQHSLEIPERTTNGWKNYRYVKGTASSVYEGVDLATALRSKINKKLGSYEDTIKKSLVGTWSEVGDNISSYFDAAYFLLNSIFVSGSYNEPQSDYNYLVLSAGTDAETKDKVYVFDGGFTDSSTASSAKSAVKYDTTNKTIQNSSAVGKTHFVYETSNSGTDSTTTLNPFLPITSKNNANGQTATTYYQDDGVINTVKGQEGKDTLKNRNYNFALVSEGTFVYHADDELFFEFEGDDDVYLFINNELVMDIGSAHSIDSVRFELNDYVNAAKAGTLGSDARNKALNLAEGESYSFKFYYMERHSYGSNMRIMTNIRVTDPKMETVKTAWQDGSEIAYGGIVDKDKVIEYGFSIKNAGEVNLHNLTFDDGDIGVRLDYEKGLTVKDDYNGVRVFDPNGGTLEVTDLTAIVSHPNYADITVKFEDNKDLIAFLKDLTGDGLESGQGLFVGATVQIRGIGYMLTEKQIKDAVFDNTVNTWATGNGEVLQGNDNMRVFVPSDPMYYQWAGHELVVDKEKFIKDVTDAASNENNTLYDKNLTLTVDKVTKFEIVSKSGGVASNDYVKIADDFSKITINYPSARSYVFYVKVTYDGSKTLIVPVLVNVTDVKDSYIVLDYGLPVEIKLADINQNDTLTVTGRSTNSSIIAIGSNGAYSSNEITFDIDEDGEIVGKYGKFEFENGVITYTPTSFIEGEDSIQIALNVYETGITPSNIKNDLNINKEVEMYKTITIIPATVMYYEDTFPSIKYTDEYTATTPEKYVQSADQTEEYGHDPVYANDENKQISGGTANKIALTGNDLASFTFNGTGFELIARTNATDTGSLIVKATVEIVPEAVGYAMRRGVDKVTIPVIMEFDNGNDGGTEAIYQVPVVRVDDLNYNRYTVTVKGVQAYDRNGAEIKEKDTYLYFDGLRIYNPCADTYYDKYLSTEANAEFVELREQIVDCYAGAVQYTEDGNMLVSSGTTTWAENLVGTYEEVSSGTKPSYTSYVAESVNDYLFRGPNNEVYMIGQSSQTTSETKVDKGSAIVFYVKETEATAHSLQIALRAIDLAAAFGAGTSDMEIKIMYGVAGTDGTLGWTPLVTTSSGTEQYYTIDYTKCVKVNDAYQIVVRVDTGMVSYSSLKLVGLELVDLSSTLLKAEGTDLRYENGILVATPAEAGTENAEATYNMLRTISRQMNSNIMMSPNGTILLTPSDSDVPNDPDMDDNDSVYEDTAHDYVIPILNLLSLNVKAGEGGSISPEGELIIALGAGRTFTITPDDGYEIEDVLVNGKSVGAVEKYTLKAATADTVIEARFRKLEAAEEP